MTTEQINSIIIMARTQLKATPHRMYVGGVKVSICLVMRKRKTLSLVFFQLVVFSFPHTYIAHT